MTDDSAPVAPTARPKVPAAAPVQPSKAYLGQQERVAGAKRSALREQVYAVIFEAETPGGRAFDIALLWVILASVLAVLLESVVSVQHAYGWLLITLEWIFTAIFATEYGLRLYCARRRLRYALSFFGIIDVLSLLPTLVGLFLTGAQSLLVLRALRLLRMFRVLKVVRHLSEAHSLVTAIRASIPKISVFIGTVLIVALIVGAFMYVIEDPKDGFTSVPRSMYWAIVTMTTVGYGDIAPKTVLGQSIAAMLMIIGYGIIAVPTGIVSAQFVTTNNGPAAEDTTLCHKCGARGHDAHANFCRVCGSGLD